MGWHEVKDDAGNVIGTMHICTRGTPRRRCSVPGCDRPGTRLCDAPVQAIGRRTCDAALCQTHAYKHGPRAIDLCPAHRKALGHPSETPRQAAPARAPEAFAPSGPGSPTPADEARLEALVRNLGITRDAAREMLGC